MPRCWTPEQKAAQAAAIRRWRPWEQSTGPKTPEGKAIASQNAYAHGMRSAEAIARDRSTATYFAARGHL